MFFNIYDKEYIIKNFETFIYSNEFTPNNTITKTLCADDPIKFQGDLIKGYDLNNALTTCT